MAEKDIMSQSAINDLINMTVQRPGLAHIYSLEVDRYLCSHGLEPFTYSALDFNGAIAVKVIENRWKKVNTINANDTQQNVILKAEQLAIKENNKVAIAYAFNNAVGLEVNALNLLYANHGSYNELTRLYYLNKYLSKFNYELDLSKKSKCSFFDRLSTVQTYQVIDDELVTIIIPAFNAEKSIAHSLESLQRQTWSNLEIIVIDDASSDRTYDIALSIASKDPRIQVIRNTSNVGPYVSRNRGLLYATGDWITIQDADDWALPRRVECQVKATRLATMPASVASMLRMTSTGVVTRPIEKGKLSNDGYLRYSFVSLLIRSSIFRSVLGAWDNVRAGADAELLARLTALNIDYCIVREPVLLCRDDPSSITNHHALGLKNRCGEVPNLRIQYRDAYENWHKKNTHLFVNPLDGRRAFPVPKKLAVSEDLVRRVMASTIKNQASKLPEKLGDINRTQGLIIAQRIARQYNYKLGLLYAKAALSETYRHTVNILRANQAADEKDYSQWIVNVNKYLNYFNLENIYLIRGKMLFDRFTVNIKKDVEQGPTPLISVIMAAWNAESTIKYAIMSILNQTWPNLELIIIDDASTDDTAKIIAECMEEDSRIRMFQNSENVGPYVSKNIGLTQARGEWITGHDSDDWAHPERLARQIRYCLKKGLHACMAGSVRMSARGHFVRLNPIGEYVFDGVCRSAFISLMVRRQYFLDRIGSWDSVRAGADSELIRRLEISFGPGRKVRTYKEPLLITLDSPRGLTNDPVLGRGRVNQEGALIRKKYQDNYRKYHKSLTKLSARLEFMDINRPFPAPKEMECDKAKIFRLIDNYRRRHVYLSRNVKTQVVLITTLRFPGGNASSTLDEIHYFKEQGIEFLIIHCPVDPSSGLPISNRYDDYSQFIVNWTEIKNIEAEVLICRHPSVICSNAFNQLSQKINAKIGFYVINNSFKRPDGDIVYERERLINRIRQMNVESRIICPISPFLREELMEYIDQDNGMIKFAETDWNPTFDLNAYYSSPKSYLDAPFSIGRHGRDGQEKWLEDPELLLQVYPNHRDFKISILGGADKATQILNILPDNWTVHKFGSIDPQDYLSKLDVFVYFPNSMLTEGFGRIVVEAMLAGVPVILPQRFEKTFGSIPLYCTPQNVSTLIQLLCEDSQRRMQYLHEVQQIAINMYSRNNLYRRFTNTSLKFKIDIQESTQLQLSSISMSYREDILSSLRKQ